MTDYSWVKVVHLVAIAVWIGGMLATDLALLAIPAGGPAPALHAMRRWNRIVTLPAMLATWAAGLTMAVWMGWWHEGWVWAKALVVLVLSGMFGAQTATLRRLAAGERPWRWMQLSLLVIVAALPIAAGLAVGKPF